MTVTDAAMHVLCEHSWPGNLREMRNLLEYAAATLQTDVLDREQLCPLDEKTVANAPSFVPIAQEVEALEKRRMSEALAASAGVKVAAAKLLDMPLRTFKRKARQFEL